MDKYISAEELKKHFPHDEDWDCPVNTNSLVCELIDAQPAADVDYERGFIEGYTKAESDIFHGGKYAPVKHGHWLYNKLWGTECSECGTAMFEMIGVSYSTYRPKYCPNCGAKMDEPAMKKQQGASNEEKIEKTLKGLADKICDLINQPYFSKLAKACNIVVCDLCENADQCKDKPLPPGMQCLGWEPIGGCKK